MTDHYYTTFFYTTFFARKKITQLVLNSGMVQEVNAGTKAIWTKDFLICEHTRTTDGAVTLIPWTSIGFINMTDADREIDAASE